ncbi:MAG: tRNA (guanosine(37)-N1)-methyltransferase TrmD [Pseudomonadota bacterium]
MLNIGLITLFPEIFNCLHYSIPDRALKQQLARLYFWNPRDFTTDKHQQVDDKPYGGGPGMLMKVAPLRRAINAAKAELPTARTVYLSPQGKLFKQSVAKEIIDKNQSLILISGRYEGLDERLLGRDIDEEWSIGDYVLSGGELAAAVLIDALLRLLPGVVGDPNSVIQDSFYDDLLDYPQYTRPKVIDGDAVPDVLLRGNHAEIAQWRRKQALGRTWLRRPDLLQEKVLSVEDQALLRTFIDENK